MKYDLVNDINEALRDQSNMLLDTRTNEKKQRQLSEYEIKKIHTMQNQWFPELDGLRFAEINDNANYHTLIVNLGGLKKSATLYCNENNMHLLTRANDTYIEFIREPESIIFNYVYGEDIICFYEGNNKVIIRIYTNSAAKEFVKKSNAQPTKTIPDIEFTYHKDISQNSYQIHTENGYNISVNCQSDTYLFDWRVVCKILDDEYHVKYVDAIQPRSK